MVHCDFRRGSLGLYEATSGILFIFLAGLEGRLSGYCRWLVNLLLDLVKMNFEDKAVRGSLH